MKKILNLSLILFIFCLTFTFGGINFSTQTTYADGEANKIEISTAEQLNSYIDGYGSGMGASGSEHVVLKDNIDMSNYVLKNTIGTETTPFSGIFDGNGYTISNLTIDARVDFAEQDAVADTNQYAGLFGYANGATIKNVAFAGTSTIKVGGYDSEDATQIKTGAVNIYAGLLAGRAENSAISMVQSTANLTLDSQFNSNLYFGSLIGSVSKSSKLSYLNVNSTQSHDWTLNSPDGKMYNIGGIVGYFSESEMIFSISIQDFKILVDTEFIGKINFGGITGVATQGGCTMVNLAGYNTYNIVNNSKVSVDTKLNVGEVAGVISTPAPKSGNISYIYFRDNGLNAFGDKGSYSYVGTKHETDYVATTLYPIVSLGDGGNSISLDFFESQQWHPTAYGVWDFDTVWYVGNMAVRLQCFSGDYSVKYVENISSSNVIECKTVFDSSYRYGNKIVLEIAFKEGMRDFYTVTAVNLNGQEYSKIVTSGEGAEVSYRLTNDEAMGIETTENGFNLIISSVNKSNAGNYSIVATEKTFKANVFTQLFDSENATEPVENNIPGYVYFAEGANTTTETLTLDLLAYGNTYRLRTREKTNTPNAFQGWYIVGAGDEGEDVLVGSDAILEIRFGTGYFVGDFDLYAKYFDNAQVVNFILSDGVKKIDLYSGSVSITESGTPVSISKENSNIKLEIYVEKNYDFDLDLFMDTLNTYKSDEAGKDFCTLQEEDESGNEFNYYNFSLDMTVLNKDDFGETFEIKTFTEVVKEENGSWIWIAVGCGGGVVVIAIIVLIIVFVRRRNSFGGGSKSFKKSFKGGYY